MYKHILVAIDGSTTSERALREAVDLAKDQGAKLRIVYVVDEVLLFNDTEFVDRTAIERTWIDKGKAALEQARRLADLEGVQAETKMLETESVGEHLADAVVQDGVSWPADLMVVGTHGRKGLKHFLLGSVAEGIIRISPIPILLVRSK